MTYYYSNVGGEGISAEVAIKGSEVVFIGQTTEAVAFCAALCLRLKKPVCIGRHVCLRATFFVYLIDSK